MFFLHGYFSNWLEVGEMSYLIKSVEWCDFPLIYIHCEKTPQQQVTFPV